EDLTRAVVEAPAPTMEAVPAGLRETVLARLDARPGMREVAAALATLGDARPLALLSRLTAVQGPALRAALDALAAARLVDLAPGGGYRFRHELYREAVYAAQSEAARRGMHARIAELVEREHPELRAEEPEMLAHHLAEAGRLDDSAVLWCRAGVRERRRGSYAEAVAHLRRAEALLQVIPDGATRDHLELEILVTLGMSEAALRGFATPQVAALHERAVEVARRVDAGPVLYAALDELWRFYYSRGDFTGALALAGLYRDTVRRTSELGRLCASYTSLGSTACQTGRLEEAREDLEVSLALYDTHARVPGTDADAVDPGLTGGACLSTVLCLLGFLDQAHRQLHATLERTETTEARGGTLTRVHVHIEAARMLTHRRDLDEALAHARKAVAMANKLGYASAALLATLVLGVALAERGESAEALELLAPGIDRWRATGVEVHRPHLLGALARAQADHGDPDAALASLDDALTHTGTFGERVYVAELHRLRGEILRAQGGAGAAEAFARALTTAQAQGARLFELRAAMSLYRLRLDSGAAPRAIKESRARVAELRDAFGEGQATADLREAAALLGTARGPAAGRVAPLE
ncbi:MAG TPA: tetratricopeptide repeat protein, partial [Terriglobales bacterium]|nr:tetratricopeptide repeat protein [Terriglobales bacterium]